ncbi:hypothetical protein VYH75_06905 [Streptococcus anginosus]|uniref:Uncharacterized protein n=1 Tax=Streptococcus anginosus TaxID=1328 RepID=A0AAW5TFA4_STRAP|nr:hypothetical protein [Streptococcus anginosus]KAA9229301.1 hypothetical protein F6I38_05155 [Streptococcus anginosus]KAA9321323.1 hypothetical protein F6H95_09255 [Streptococcus anginosus]MCW0929357.1 hypothetical protein [Streptococcus anginosus]MCW0951331.1 hypothetical protein [Streptococcus anginosus]MCW0999671.1 hypothetical protein [Streptococcus anginosus]
MSEQYRDIRKEINLTANELKQIEQLMRENHYRHFSPFVRDKLLMTDDKQLTAKRSLRAQTVYTHYRKNRTISKGQTDTF